MLHASVGPTALTSSNPTPHVMPFLSFIRMALDKVRNGRDTQIKRHLAILHVPASGKAYKDPTLFQKHRCITFERAGNSPGPRVIALPAGPSEPASAASDPNPNPFSATRRVRQFAHRAWWLHLTALVLLTALGGIEAALGQTPSSSDATLSRLTLADPSGTVIPFSPAVRAPGG